MTVLFPSKPNILAVVELAGFTSHFRVLSLIRIIKGITDDAIYITVTAAQFHALQPNRPFSLYVSFPLSKPRDSIPENCFFQISSYPRAYIIEEFSREHYMV